MATLLENTKVPYISEMSYDHVMGCGNGLTAEKVVDFTASYKVQFNGFSISTEIRGLQFQNYSAEELINLIIDKVKSELP